MKIKEIYHYINEIAPFDRALDYDNCGILLGDPEKEVTKCLICLDVTEVVLKEAVRIGATHRFASSGHFPSRETDFRQQLAISFGEAGYRGIIGTYQS